MKKLLIPVDDSNGARVGVQTCIRLFGSGPAVSVHLLHVMQPGGKSLLHDRISDPELGTLRRQLEAAGKMEEIERAAQTILKTHEGVLRQSKLARVKTLLRFGHVAEEIIKTATELEADLIILGSSRTLLQKLLMGDIVREVADKAKAPVLIAR